MRLDFLGTIKKNIAYGALFIVPAGLTIYILYHIVTSIDYIFKVLADKYDLWIFFPGQGILFIMILLFMAGLMLRGFFGNIFRRLNDFFFESLPGIGIIYKGTKKILETIAAPKDSSETSYLGVVMVDFPSKDIQSIGLVTSKGTEEIKKDGEQLYAIYIPTTPIPSSGFTVYMKKEDLQFVELSVEEAMSMIVSAGVVK